MAAGGDAIARDRRRPRRVRPRCSARASWSPCEIVRSKKDFVRGRRARCRRAGGRSESSPPCPGRAAGCGGCSWQHVDADAQLGLKAAVVAEALTRTGKLDRSRRRDRRRQSPAWAYRTTLRVAAGRGGRVGLPRRAVHTTSSRSAGASSAHPLLAELLPTAASRCSGRGHVCVSARPPANGRRGSSTATVDAARRLPADVDDRADGDGSRGRRRAARCACRRGVVLPVGTGRPPNCSSMLVREACRRARRGRVRRRRLRRRGPVRLRRCGARRLTIVEASETACADAAGQPRRSPGDHRLLAGGAMAAAPRLISSSPTRHAAVSGRQAVAVLVGTQARRIVVVSCDPVSLARDAGLLARIGLRPRAFGRLRPVPADATTSRWSPLSTARRTLGDAQRRPM